MKSFRPVRYSFKRRNLLLMGLLYFYISLSGQNDNLLLPDIFYPGYIQDDNLVEIKEDTTIINDIIHVAGNLMRKQRYLDLDSVRYLLHKARSKSLQFNYTHGELISYQALGWTYMYKGILDSSQHYFRKAIIIDEVRRDTNRLKWHYECLGMALHDEFKYDSACLMYKKANELAVMTRDTSSITTTISKLGRTYMQNGDMMMSAIYTLELVRIAEIKNDTGAIILAYSRLSDLYSYMGLKEMQLDLVRILLKISKGIKNGSLLYKVNNLATEAYHSSGQYDSVIYYARLNLPALLKSKSFPLSYRALADVYLATEQIDSAKYYYALLIKEYDRTNSPIESGLYLNLGQCEFKSGNQQKALAYYRLAEANVDKNNIFSEQYVYKVLAEYFDGSNDFKTSLAYFKKSNELEDSIKHKRDAFNAGLVTMVVESKRMKDQIVDLSLESQYQALLVSKQKLENKFVYGGSVFIICLGVFGFIRFRKNRNLKSKQVLLNERLRISRELHDEVGATLSGIAMYSHVAKDQLKQERHEEASSSLSFMQKSAGEMVNKLSDIVWLINPEQDTILEIIGRLGEYGKQMAGAKNMQMKLDVPSELTGLHIPLEARRNIYLICKEAINNAVKYSHGRFVELHVNMEDSLLSFLVLDDGNGFDMGTIKHGNGLINMKKRAVEIGANFQVESSPYNGTRIEIQYKLIH